MDRNGQPNNEIVVTADKKKKCIQDILIKKLGDAAGVILDRMTNYIRSFGRSDI